MTKTQIKVLEEAIKAAKLELCAVAEEHKDAMRLYLNTWVVTRLEAILAVEQKKASNAELRASWELAADRLNRA